MTSRQLIIAWAYFSEILLSILLVLFLYLITGEKTLIEFIQKTAIDFATLYCAVVIAAAFAFLWTLYSKIDSSFYVWLEREKSLDIFINATIYVLVVQIFSVISLILCKYFPNNWLSLASCGIFFLAFINSITIITNSVGLMKLKILYTRLTNERQTGSGR